MSDEKLNTCVSGIAWTNGGKELAVATPATTVRTPDHLRTVPIAGGAAVDRPPKLDGSIVSVANDPHGTVWVEMHKGTIIEVYAYKEGKLEPAYRWLGGVVLGNPVGTGFAFSPEVLAFTVGDPAHSPNVAVAHQGELQKITHEGDDTLGKVELGDVRVVKWTAKDGTKLEGILTLPAKYHAGQKYPFLVLPHGAPDGHDRHHFHIFSRLISGLRNAP